ncbi:dipeptidyl aminopeptidase [Lentinus tigrinus ALCF2SS1-7]|uniref:Dipeptidyl aminopeptidase n=1 Tax=Lentinus tigrinus ALCF2SS1-6 TaxID=1328759 RepID=A0A5C2S352_9APHY|nr:dipeptidyl aminopeptidase [Lentinus tigrinus ALCF2SS1-6]RPD73048.1 dipeptidyl aminopeptidase [Lentinus tigrinus ALCF2SS1-7]
MAPTDYEPLSQADGFFEGSSSDHPAAVNTAYPPKPETYYGDGPFDAPSSDDESEELLEKGERQRTGRAIEEEGHLVIGSGGRKKRPASLKFLVISLVSLVSIAVVIGIFAARSYTGTAFQIQGVQHLTMDHIFNGTFSAARQDIHWVPEAGDGVFAVRQGSSISLVDLKSNSTKELLTYHEIKDENGSPLNWVDWKLSSDMKYIMVQANYKKQWRHSSFGNYYVHEFATKETRPLLPPSNPAVTSYAAWSPTGESIAFVAENDLYVVPSPFDMPVRVTTSGNASLFHGVPDWVYEEEVFSADFTLWWAPDSSKLAFLAFDETAVDEFTFPIYNPTEDSYAVVPYPDSVTMKYPKPGYNNPLVSVHVFQMDEYLSSVRQAGGASNVNTTDVAQEATLELNWDGRQAADNSIIAEVAWVSPSTLLVKEVTRAAEDGSVVFFDLNTQPANIGKIVRELGRNGEQGDDGWIDATQAIYPIGPELSPTGEPAYLDIVPTPEGYNHIALFSPADSSTPQFLTSGEWEVTSEILAVDVNRSLVYFQAANPSSTQRHIYSVPLPKLATEEQVAPTALTDTSSPGYYDASFSPEGGFYLLSYRGPHVPWQRIVHAGDDDFDYVLTENPQLNETLATYELPIRTHSTIESDGYELNVLELRPPRMDDSGRTKYPVLFRVYGGPGSQMVDVKYAHDWHDYVVSELQYIVVVVDGRGTGYKGRKLRNPVKNNLGRWETVDQINAAKEWAKKEYVDPKRIGIWGWSYGGFMSSKVIEADARVHSLAMAVAPVTSWRLYDSVYTERYMNLPAANPDGYITASISNVTGFHHADFLLAHGSGDDNVHYANSAHLLDMFTREQVRDFRFRMFTDSDHSIYRRGANRELYEFLTKFLVEKWGKGGKRRAW